MRSSDPVVVPSSRAANVPAASESAPTPEPTPAPREPTPAPREPRAAPAAAPPVTPPPAPLTAEQLYARADAALAKQDLAAADKALALIATIQPQPALAGQAIFDRARIAYQRHDWSAARAHLAKLDGVADAALRESGHYLSCRIAVESHDAHAAACLTAFRKAYPQSAHDRDSLGALTGLAYAAGGCAAAKADVGELGLRYPHSALAAAWRAKCAEGL